MNKEDLEDKIIMAVEKIVSQFETYPNIIPDKVTLYNGEPRILKMFSNALVPKLWEKGYVFLVVRGDSADGYSIDVNAMLKRV